MAEILREGIPLKNVAQGPHALNPALLGTYYEGGPFRDEKRRPRVREAKRASCVGWRF